MWEVEAGIVSDQLRQRRGCIGSDDSDCCAPPSRSACRSGRDRPLAWSGRDVSREPAQRRDRPWRGSRSDRDGVWRWARGISSARSGSSRFVRGGPDRLLAPYQIIHVGAAAPEIPQALIDQLAKPGRMFIPVGEHSQGRLLHSWRVRRLTDRYMAGRQVGKRQGDKDQALWSDGEPAVLTSDQDANCSMYRSRMPKSSGLGSSGVIDRQKSTSSTACCIDQHWVPSHSHSIYHDGDVSLRTISTNAPLYFGAPISVTPKSYDFSN